MRTTTRDSSRRSHRCRSLLPLLIALSGCAAPAPTRSWLDERTAATITVQGTPAVFARDEQMRAINVRDYAQVGALQVNRMGERRWYLAVIVWSTIDRPLAERERLIAAFAHIRLQADDRTLSLSRVERRPEGVGTRPFPLPTPGAHEAYFPISAADLQFLASSTHVRLTAAGSVDGPQVFEEWRDGRAGLKQFLAQTATR